jgi:hypothetical protein
VLAWRPATPSVPKHRLTKSIVRRSVEMIGKRSGNSLDARLRWKMSEEDEDDRFRIFDIFIVFCHIL